MDFCIQKESPRKSKEEVKKENKEKKKVIDFANIYDPSLSKNIKLKGKPS